MKPYIRMSLGLALWVSVALSVRAQTQDLAFAYKAAGTTAATAVGNNGQIEFPSTVVGDTSAVTLVAQNTSQATYTLVSASTNTPAFVVSPTGGGSPLTPEYPTLSFSVTFRPTISGPATGVLTVTFSNGVRNITYTFFLNALATAPNLIFSYVQNPSGNQVLLRDKDTAAFPNTAVNNTASVTFVIANTGNGPGKVDSIGVTGAAFSPSGVPLLPLSLDPNKEARFSVVFSPKTRDAATGSVRIVYGKSVLTVALTGQGIDSVLTYEALVGSSTLPLSPNSTLGLPSTAVGSTQTASIIIRNKGDAEGRVSTISLSGTAFKLNDVPPVPAVIPPGGSISLGITFAPVQAGPASARLLIDSVAITLQSVGNGSQLTYSYRVGSTITPIADAGGSIVFPNTTVGAKSPVYVRVGNTGNASGSVNGISVNGSAFSVALPSLPASIAPNAALEFAVTFAPDAVGALTGQLQIDDRSIALRGTGNAPPPLPSVSFTGLSDSAQPLDQPKVGLSLAEPYPLDLTGKLTLSFTSDSFVDDPAIQFAAGGRSVDFRIPANTLDALVGDAKQVQFQVGTVAGVISVTASFAAGAVNVTPTPAPSKNVLIAAAPPVVRNLQIGLQSDKAFELLVTGLSTPRSVTQLNLTLTATPGSNLQTTSLTVNVESAFTAWFQSQNAKAFGSQFTASIPVNVTGDVNAIQSVQVVLVNQRGASDPMSLKLR